jgi:hypothetical protein
MFEGPGELGRKLVANMAAMTADRIGDVAFENARSNLRWRSCGRSLSALRREKIGEGDGAVIIAAGPSVQRRDPVRLIKEKNFKGAVVVTESAIAYCLRSGVVPDLVVTLDPHATRIVRWFGDPHLDEHAVGQDDYYRRQDMDPAFRDELRFNRELIASIDRHAPDMRIALATSASEAVVRRVVETGMKIYWWNPMLDDPDAPQSRTRALQAMNRWPCVNAGGNVGTACWMIAHAVLGKRRVALTGVDFSYYDGTPYSKTQYYHEAVALVGVENLDAVYMRVFNPHLGVWFYTDPAYMWYRSCFLELAKDAECATYNCTEGGILFGEGVDFTPLAAFLGEDGAAHRDPAPIDGAERG